MASQRVVLPIAGLALIGLSQVSSAVVTGPYTPDAHTLHLWHFDSPTGTTGYTAADVGNSPNNMPLTGTYRSTTGGASNGTSVPNTSLLSKSNLISSTLAAGSGWGGALNAVDPDLSDQNINTNSSSNRANWTVTSSFVGARDAGAYSAENVGQGLGDFWNDGSGDEFTGAFTWEAVVQIKTNIFSDTPPKTAGNTSYMILSANNEGSANVNGNGMNKPAFLTIERASNQTYLLFSQGWNYTAADDGTGTVATNNYGNYRQEVKANLPSSGADAVAVNGWYHVAAVYTGEDNVTGNFKLYWTRIDATTQATAAHELTPTSFDLVGPSAADGVGNKFSALQQILTDEVNQPNALYRDLNLGGTTSGFDWAIGQSARQAGSETVPGSSFEGLIDEVRISDIARGPGDFIFAVPEPSAIGFLAPAALLAMRRRRRAR